MNNVRIADFDWNKVPDKYDRVSISHEGLFAYRGCIEGCFLTDRITTDDEVITLWRKAQ